MRRLLFILAPVALAAMLQVSHAAIVTVGANVNVTKQLGSQSETSIAINRANTNQVALASNFAYGTNMVNKYSTDGGATWANSSLVVAGGYDSWMGADRFGNSYLSYQTRGGTTHVARSIDGGANYTNLFNAGSSADHPEMAVGPGVAAGTSSIYLRDTVAGQSRIISATSTALGATGSFSTQVNQGAGNFGSSAVGPNGQTVFTAMSPSGGIGPASMVIRYDATGTAPGGYVAQSTVTTNVGGFRPIPAQPSRTIDTQVALQYDSSGGIYNGDLYMLYTQAANASTADTDIVFRRSTDNGVTFSSELRLNTDVGINSQFFGRMAIDQVTGYLGAVWYDTRNSANNTGVELWGTISTDGGSTWEPNFKISQGMTDGRLSNTGDANELGDYISLDFYDGKMVTAWADSSNSTGDNPDGTRGLDIYFARIEVSASNTGQLPEPSTLALAAAALFAGVCRSRRG